MGLRCRLFGRCLSLIMTLLCAFSICMPSVAYAAPHTVHWVSDSTANHISGTTLYISNVSEGNGSISNVSGNVYQEDNNIKAHEGASSGSWVMTYSNAGYDIYGRNLDVRMTCTASFPDADYRPAEGMQLFSLAGGASCDAGVHVAVRIKIDVLDKSGNSVSGTFGIQFGDLDVQCPDDHLYDEGVELVSGCGTEVWIGEAISEANGHNSWDADSPTEGQRMDVETHDGHTLINASHDCGGLNDSSFSCICTSGAQLIWRGGNGLGSSIGIRSSTTVYPDLGNPTKVGSPASASAAGGSYTFTITQTFPDVVSSNQANSIKLSDTFAKCLDVANASYSVTRTDANGNQSNVTSNWTKSVSGQTLTLSAVNTGHGYATLKHVFTVTIPIRKSYDFCDSQLYFAGTALCFSNTASISVTPRTGSSVTKTTNTITNDVTGVVTPTILLQKGDTDRGAGKAQGDTTLAGATYKVEYWPAWSMSGNPTATGTWTTDASGNLTFTKGSWPYGSTYGSLPFGTYRVTEIFAPAGYSAMGARTFQVRANNSSGTVIVTKDSSWDSGSSSSSVGLVSLEPSIVRGPVSGRVVDYDMITAQGDGYIAGAVVGIRNASSSPVVVNGMEYAVGATISTTTVGEAGTFSFAGLPYGTYEVFQQSAPAGYAKDTSVKRVSVRSTSGVAAENLREQIWRGSTILEKHDADSHTTTPQGDALLAGAVFEIVNRSAHDVVVNGTRYAIGAVCWSGQIQSSGVWEMVARTLPYGTYDIREKFAPVGYRETSTVLTFEVRADGQVVTHTV